MTVPTIPSAPATILDAAERLFAEQGYAGTTIKDIGAAAGVNSALLYYYFENKETLYREMLRRIVIAFVERVGARLAPGMPPEEGVRRLVETQSEVISGHPHLARLVVRELVDHQAAHSEAAITHLAANLFERLCGFIRDGQKSGVFRHDLDPRFAAISVISQVAYMNLARPAAGILLGYGMAGPPAPVLRAFGSHAADFALAALRAPARSPSRRAGRRARTRTTRKPQ